MGGQAFGDKTEGADSKTLRPNNSYFKCLNTQPMKQTPLTSDEFPYRPEQHNTYFFYKTHYLLTIF